MHWEWVCNVHKYVYLSVNVFLHTAILVLKFLLLWLFFALHKIRFCYPCVHNPPVTLLIMTLMYYFKNLLFCTLQFIMLLSAFFQNGSPFVEHKSLNVYMNSKEQVKDNSSLSAINRQPLCNERCCCCFMLWIVAAMADCLECVVLSQKKKKKISERFLVLCAAML